MHPTEARFAISSHWPYVDRQLEQLAPSMRRTLELLARRQTDALGELVLLGTTRLRLEEGLTAGEARTVGKLLRELEARRVVERRPGRGSAASAWGLRGDLERWRAMPWATSARSVASVVFGCARSRICEASYALARQSPDQRPGGDPVIVLGTGSHLCPPGLTLVDWPRNGGTGRANADGRACGPVDSPRKAPPEEAASPIPVVTTDRRANYLGKTATSYLPVPETARLEELQAALVAGGGDRIWEASKRFPELVELTGYNDAQVAFLARVIRDGNRGRAIGHRMLAPKLLELAQRAAKDAPAFAALADPIDVEA